MYLGVNFDWRGLGDLEYLKAGKLSLPVSWDGNLSNPTVHTGWHLMVADFPGHSRQGGGYENGEQRNKNTVVKESCQPPPKVSDLHHPHLRWTTSQVSAAE